MSIPRRKDDYAPRTVRVPSVKMPRVKSGSRNPAGWGNLDIAIRGRGSPIAGKLTRPEPAGDPPEDWTGTRPEWAVYWGLRTNGLQEGDDFVYQARLPGVGAGYFSQVDFLIESYSIGIEVQGKFWHYGQGTQKILTDMFRENAFAGQGIKIVFIDESDALEDPRYYVGEALRGNDHSHVKNTGKAQ